MELELQGERILQDGCMWIIWDAPVRSLKQMPRLGMSISPLTGTDSDRHLQADRTAAGRYHHHWLSIEE